MKSERKILLSFDVEEFDLPLEYGQTIPSDEQLQVGYRGLTAIAPLLDTSGICTTLFTTAFFAQHYPEKIKQLSSAHEIASHSFYHSTFNENDLQTSREVLEAITGNAVSGLRMPRMRKVAPAAVLDAGYTYNSSINPTWVPGRYNNLHLPRHPFAEEKILQFPVSVTPHLRIPLFWLAFKNLPYPVFLKLALQTLAHDGYLCLYFHPWEFTDIDSYPIPAYLKRNSKEKLLQKLLRLVKDLSNEGNYMRMDDFIKTYPLLKES